MSKSYLDLVLEYKISPEDIDIFISRWHSFEGQDKTLHQYLGLTWEEYSRYVEDSRSLYDILKERGYE